MALIKGITLHGDWKVVYAEWAPQGLAPTPASITPTGARCKAVPLGSYV